MSTNMDNVVEGFGDKLGTSIFAFSAVVSGFVCAFISGWQLAAILCVMLPLMAVGAAQMGKAMQSIQLETQDWYSKAASVVEECLYSIRTVVAFGGEKQELQKYEQALVSAKSGGVQNGIKIGLGMGWTMMIMMLSYSLAFYVGMRFRYDNLLNPSTGKPWQPGEILTIFFCIMVGGFSLGSLDPGVKAFQKARMGAASFFEAMENPGTIQCKEGDVREVVERIDSFELRDVHFSYPQRPDVPVLQGLSLLIPTGRRIAVVGESGSGKSTVMSLLERFYDVQQGEVLVNGKNIKSFSIQSLRRCIGYVGQEPVLFATTIRNNILQGLDGISEEDLQKATNDAKLDFVNDLPKKMETFVGSGGSQFSGGQKQRIAIARALVKKPKVLFLDEATSALDNASEKMIQNTIDSISEENAGRLTTISIAHRLTTVRNCDIIYVMKEGRIVEQGNHKALIEAGGMYHALVASQESAAAKEETQRDSIGDAGSDGLARGVSPGSAAPKSDGVSLELPAADDEKLQKEIAKKYKPPLLRIMSFNKPEWGYFVPALLGSLYDGASQPILGMILVLAMDSFYKENEQMKDDIEQICLVFLLVSLGEFLALLIMHSSFAILGEAMTMRIRIATLSAIFRQEVGFHDAPGNTPGMLAKSLELYAFRVSNLCRSTGPKVSSMASLCTGLFIGFYFCWQMALVMLASMPILIVANALQMLIFFGGAQTENENLKIAQQVISESVQNSRTVHACGTEKALVELYHNSVGKCFTPLIKVFLSGTAFGLSNGVQFWIMAGGFYYAGTLVDGGVADFMDVTAAFMGIFYAAMGAGMAAGLLPDAVKATVAAHDMFLLLDRKSLINAEAATGEQGQALVAGQIEYRDVHFHYPSRPEVQVHKGLSFSVLPGQSVGLVGPSGGGKSTVMALLQRFYDPVQGNIFIGAAQLPLREVDIIWWRKQLGYVGQEPVLFNTTVRANVLYGMERAVENDHLEKCWKMANLDFLSSSGSNGWETQVGPRGSQLSGGQKQRVAICRALLRNPAVLLLDEATSALDSQSERVVQEALEKARLNRTSFTIAHRLSTIVDCDIILVVAEGIVKETGTHTELISQGGIYAKLQKQSRGQ
mmetsp:Transcript_7569/g.16469  ORF Transcript_7569/g.16469 Transcript_7569/m.16469 type:complete len:1107 (+) Transcript_7569:1-3321(+)